MSTPHQNTERVAELMKQGKTLEEATSILLKESTAQHASKKLGREVTVSEPAPVTMSERVSQLRAEGESLEVATSRAYAERTVATASGQATAQALIRAQRVAAKHRAEMKDGYTMETGNEAMARMDRGYMPPVNTDDVHQNGRIQVSQQAGSAGWNVSFPPIKSEPELKALLGEIAAKLRQEFATPESMK
jgi:hypothetical protein